MLYCNDKDVDKVVRLLLQKGWAFRRQKKHGLLIAPSGHKVTVSSTPSCSRTLQNFMSQIRWAERDSHG